MRDSCTTSQLLFFSHTKVTELWRFRQRTEKLCVCVFLNPKKKRGRRKKDEEDLVTQRDGIWTTSEKTRDLLYHTPRADCGKSLSASVMKAYGFGDGIRGKHFSYIIIQDAIVFLYSWGNTMHPQENTKPALWIWRGRPPYFFFLIMLKSIYDLYERRWSAFHKERERERRQWNLQTAYGEMVSWVGMVNTQ